MHKKDLVSHVLFDHTNFALATSVPNSQSPDSKVSIDDHDHDFLNGQEAINLEQKITCDQRAGLVIVFINVAVMFQRDWK